MNVLNDAIKKMDLLERFELFTVSPRDVDDFNQKLDDFIKKIASMPQSKLLTVEDKGLV